MFAVLGPLQVHADGRSIAVSARQERTLLAMLLVQPNALVATDRLVEALWPSSPPSDSRRQLQRCVHRLRRRLAGAGVEGGILVTEAGGYRIAVAPEQLDLLSFRRAISQARADIGRGRPHEAVTAYRAALDLWRGPALADVDSARVRLAAATLNEEHAQAQAERFDAELATGEGDCLVAELTELVQHHPYWERLHGALMRALYRAGRHADALATYRRFTERLHQHLGTEPGHELQALHRAILNHAPELDVPTGHAGAVATVPVPHELPAGVPEFTGRADATAHLDTLLASSAEPGGPPSTAVVVGGPGVGKTALAVQWAHRVAESFPDGQLHVDLRGYSPTPPLHPVEALAMLLRSLGTPTDQIPRTEAEASARYRSLLANRRVLVVLDNVRSHDQLRPLLPGSAGPFVLVTSRDRLTGLAPSSSRSRLHLGRMSPAEAEELLMHLLGDARCRREPGAVAQLAKTCGYLPLALRVAAATLGVRPHESIAAYATELDTGDRRAALHHGPDPTTMASAFDASYRALSHDARRLFRRLTLVDGPEFTSDTAAVLMDIGPGPAQHLVDQLASAHLVDAHAPGRYALHGLLHVYAEQCLRNDEDPEDRRQAATRLRAYEARG